MQYEPNNIISRIEWCRLQQQLQSVTREARAGWWAEEAGLVDALFGRDRTTFMRQEHRSQLTRYQSGLEDGQALLCLQHFNSLWHKPYGETPPKTPAQADSSPLQAPPPFHIEHRR